MVYEINDCKYAGDTKTESNQSNWSIFCLKQITVWSL